MKDSAFLRVLGLMLLMSLSLNAARPMVSYRAVELGAGTAQLGLITASFAVLSLLAAIPAGRWVDRLGEPRFLVVGGGLMSIVLLSIALTADLVWLAVSQALLGFGQVLVAVAAQTFVANGSTNETRDGRFGTFGVMTSLGQVVGPAVAGVVVARFGPELSPVFLTTMVSVGLITLVGGSFWIWPAPRIPGAVPRSRTTEPILPATKRVMATPSMPQAMLASLTALASNDILLAYLPAYGESRGLPVATVTLLLSARAAAALVSRVAMTVLARSFGRRWLLTVCLFVPGFAFGLLPFLASTPSLFVLMALIGFGLGICQPLSLSWVAAQAPVDLRATALGVRLSANRLGQLSIPAVVGLLAGSAGLSPIFVVTGALLGASAWFVGATRFPTDVS